MTATKAMKKKPKPRPPSDRNQGRKTIDPGGERMTPYHFRLTNPMRARLKQLGGAAWIRDQITTAKDSS